MGHENAEGQKNLQICSEESSQQQSTRTVHKRAEEHDIKMRFTESAVPS